MLTNAEAIITVVGAIMDMSDDVVFSIGTATSVTDENGDFIVIDAVIGGYDATFRVWDEDGITAWEVDTEFNGR